MTGRRLPDVAQPYLTGSVEFALNVLDALGHVVHASTAPLGGAYQCLQCSGGVTVVRAGEPPHFRHASDASCDSRRVEREACCDGSRVEREAGARLLAARLRRELSEDGAMTSWSRCSGPGSGESCPDGALMPTRRYLHLDAAVVLGAACPPPLDVAILRGAAMVIGFELVSHVAPSASDVTAPGGVAPQIVRFALGDVLGFRALVPLDEDPVPVCCPACRTRASTALSEAAGAKSEFLDAGFVREAARVHDMWSSVLVAAAAESAAASRSGGKAPSTTRRRRIDTW